MVSLIGNTLSDYLTSDEIVISYLNQYCSTLEEKITKNEFNPQVPLAVIETFKSIFEIWDRNLTITESLESHYREAYIMMNSKFDYDEETVKDEESILSNFIRESDQYLENLQVEENWKWTNLKGKRYAYNANDGKSYAMIKSMKNELHYDMHCELCNCVVSSTILDEDVIAENNADLITRYGDDALKHFWSSEHQQALSEFCSNRQYVDDFSQGEVSLYRCKLCDLIFGLSSLKEHYQDLEHLEKIGKFTRKNNADGTRSFTVRNPKKDEMDEGTSSGKELDVLIVDIPDPEQIPFVIVHSFSPNRE